MNMLKRKTTINDLAGIVKRGFDTVDKCFEQVDRRFEQVDRRLDQADKRLNHIDLELGRMNARMSIMERDVAEIRKHFVYRDEFEDALARISLLEKKVGVKSGK